MQGSEGAAHWRLTLGGTCQVDTWPRYEVVAVPPLYAWPHWPSFPLHPAAPGFPPPSFSGGHAALPRPHLLPRAAGAGQQEVAETARDGTFVRCAITEPTTVYTGPLLPMGQGLAMRQRGMRGALTQACARAWRAHFLPRAANGLGASIVRVQAPTLAYYR